MKPQAYSVLANATRESYALVVCPQCETHGLVDQDQFEGRVSMQCAVCPYHETHDLRAGLEEATKRYREGAGTFPGK
jgi:hypothetical protein